MGARKTIDQTTALLRQLTKDQDTLEAIIQRWQDVKPPSVSESAGMTSNEATVWTRKLRTHARDATSTLTLAQESFNGTRHYLNVIAGAAEQYSANRP